jgi:hypothetical protein
LFISSENCGTFARGLAAIEAKADPLARRTAGQFSEDAFRSGKATLGLAAFVDPESQPRFDG